MLALATALCKVHRGLGPDIMNNIFKIRNVKYNFRIDISFVARNVNSVHYGSEAISYLGPKIWDLLPKNIKDSENINIFK